MTRLSFLSPHEADVTPISPLADVPAIGFKDVSALGKLEVRGRVPERAIPIGFNRGLLVLDGDVRAERDRLTQEGLHVYDQTGALAGIEITGERLMRRLTELDLSSLPAVGSIARGIRAVIEPLGQARYRIFVPQEFAEYVATVINDLAEGIN
jgi:hypothetical protein